MNLTTTLEHLQQNGCPVGSANSFAQTQQLLFSLRSATPDYTMNRIAERMIDKLEQAEALESKIKIQEAAMEETADSISYLEQMAPETQKIYLRIYELLGQSTDQQEKELAAFRGHLEALDQQIQQYQDVVDGSPPDEQTGELDLLAGAKKTREDYLQEGAECLNQYAGKLSGDHFHCSFQNIFGENPFAEIKASDWMIHISTDNIYAEINRVIENVQDAGNVIKSGVHQILDALEKNGYGEYKYKLYRAGTPNQRKSFMTELLERISSH